MKKPQIIEFIKFTFFSISAGLIEIGSFTLLNELTSFDYWFCYLVALLLSIIWNFTLNRKFTFKATNNIPIAMLKVLIFYAIFTPTTTILGDYFVSKGLNEYLMTAINMILNFITEFFYQKYYVFKKNNNEKEELLQVFDKNNHMLNESVKRNNKKSLTSDKYIKVVYIFIINSQNEFLIQKTSKQKGNIYAVTGGHVSFHDDGYNTAIKESQEELGIDLSKEKLHLFNHVLYDSLMIDSYYVKKDININEIKLQKGEVDSVHWFNVQKIKELIKQNKFREKNIVNFNKLIDILKIK